jgi:hypothetical protein
VINIKGGGIICLFNPAYKVAGKNYFKWGLWLLPPLRIVVITKLGEEDGKNLYHYANWFSRA